MKFEQAHQAVGRNIRRPGMRWQPAAQSRMLAAEDAVADDWEVELPTAWRGEISVAHLRQVLREISQQDLPMSTTELIALVLAPLGMHRAELLQLVEDMLGQVGTTPIAKAAGAGRHKAVRKRAKSAERIR